MKILVDILTGHITSVRLTLQAAVWVWSAPVSRLGSTGEASGQEAHPAGELHSNTSTYVGLCPEWWWS